MIGTKQIIELDIKNRNIETWEFFINRLLTFLRIYKRVLDSYVLDFYSAQLWNEFRCNWQEIFEHFNHIDLSNFLNVKSDLRCKRVYPLSLLAFRATCFSFAFSRDPISGTKDPNIYFNESVLSKESQEVCGNFQVKRLNSGAPWQNPLLELNAEGGQHNLLEHIFRKHLKPKKQHEVERMAQISSRIFYSSKAEVVIDIGSGQGHLARLTAYGFCIPTICIDAEESLIAGARKFDLQLETCLKNKYDEKIVGPRHGICRLHPNLTQEDFNEIVKKIWPEIDKGKWSRSKEDEEVPFSLVGLHCCGDLGPILMRLFCSIDSCRTLLLVGCCYMKLSTESEKDNQGYPMSQFLKAKNNNSLSYNAREMACHALESYAHKLKKGADDLKVHCYRAILEELIIQKKPELKHSGLRSVKNAHLLSFHEYAVKAISRLEGMSTTELHLNNSSIQSKLKNWMRVVIFYSIRLMMAPAVESLIMLDRLFYIHEKTNAKCFYVPIFDPTLSPRNYALIATKD